MARLNCFQINNNLPTFSESNWGTEFDPDFKYHTGNSEPRGYGNLFHISNIYEIK